MLLDQTDIDRIQGDINNGKFEETDLKTLIHELNLFRNNAKEIIDCCTAYEASANEREIRKEENLAVITFFKSLATYMVSKREDV